MPNAIELRLFTLAVRLHSLQHADQRCTFERCEDIDCVETRRVLGITSHLHRFDEPPPVTEDTE